MPTIQNEELHPHVRGHDALATAGAGKQERRSGRLADFVHHSGVVGNLVPIGRILGDDFRHLGGQAWDICAVCSKIFVAIESVTFTASLLHR